MTNSVSSWLTWLERRFRGCVVRYVFGSSLQLVLYFLPYILYDFTNRQTVSSLHRSIADGDKQSMEKMPAIFLIIKTICSHVILLVTIISFVMFSKTNTALRSDLFEVNLFLTLS